MSRLPFPSRGDRRGWSRWWDAWNRVNSAATDAELVGGLDGPPEDEDLPAGVTTLAQAIDEVFAGIGDRREGGVA
jgi:hypothetical protein